MNVAKGDVLRHHSVPGVYHVLDVIWDRRVVLLDPRGERQRVQPDYLASNFRHADTTTENQRPQESR